MPEGRSPLVASSLSHPTGHQELAWRLGFRSLLLPSAKAESVVTPPRAVSAANRHGGRCVQARRETLPDARAYPNTGKLGKAPRSEHLPHPRGYRKPAASDDKPHLCAFSPTLQ